MNNARRTFLQGAALLGLAGCGESFQPLSPAGAQVANPPVEESGRLYTLHAGRGTIEGSVLTLLEAEDRVVWFEDRPGRRAGRQSLGSWVDEWSANGFTEVPPNAVLELSGRSYPLVLESPEYQGDTVRFKITPDQGGPSLQQLPPTFDQPVLFIDSASSGYPATITILLQAKALPGDGDFQVAITDGDVSFVADEDPSSFDLQSRNISQFSLRSRFMSIYWERGGSDIYLYARVLARRGGVAFSLSNTSSVAIEITAQVPEGAADRVVSPNGTAFNWPG